MSQTCPACGTALSHEYRYCLNCGKDFGAVTQAAEEPPPTLVYQGATPQFKPPTRQTHEAPKRSHLPWILVTACLVIILVLAAALIFGPKSRNQESLSLVSPTPQSSASPTTIPTIEPTHTPSASPKNSNQNSNLVGSSNANVTQPRNSPQVNISPSTENRVYSESEVDEIARISSKPNPGYTEEARANNITGTVILRVVLTADGEVTGIRVIKGLPHGLTEIAIDAAKRIRFTKAMKNGQPVSMSTQVQYLFQLYQPNF